MEQVRKELVEQFENNGITCSWLAESGGVKVSKDGSTKLTFSLRDESTYKDDLVKMKEIVLKKLPSAKFYGSNQFNTYRPQYLLTVKVSQQ